MQQFLIDSPEAAVLVSIPLGFGELGDHFVYLEYLLTLCYGLY